VGCVKFGFAGAAGCLSLFASVVGGLKPFGYPFLALLLVVGLCLFGLVLLGFALTIRGCESVRSCCPVLSGGGGGGGV
jgi:hypothetical protein